MSTTSSLSGAVGNLSFIADDFAVPFEFNCKAYLNDFSVTQETHEYRSWGLGGGIIPVVGRQTATAGFELLIGDGINFNKGNGALGASSILELLQEVNRRLEVEK